MADGPMHTVLSEKATSRLVWVVYGVCALLAVLGLGYQLFSQAFAHAHFGFESWPIFYGVFGFAAFAVIVYGGHLLGKLVARDEDYYRPDEPERSK